MCGIVGYAGRGGGLPPQLLAAMRDALTHRGPDACGLWLSPDAAVALGHRRLSIIDLSATGAQPMAGADGNSVIVFNGEIYNHEELRAELLARGARFVGRSDTEVLLAAYDAWGEDCVTRLRGMFAFAIYDAARRTLFMARDRAGEKPLFWALHRGGLVFASELKALLLDPEFPRRLSRPALAQYLSFGYVPGDHCILQGVHKLRAAHCLSWPLAGGAPRIWRYWDLPAAVADEQAADREALTDELESLLGAAVSEQLIADVPLAVLLSGGVDSSLVTAIAARASRHRVRTFTVTLPDDPQLNEARFARAVADYLGTEHVELPLDRSSVDLLQTLARQYDEPVADSSMIPTYLLARTVSRHCKVVLGGDGGDELFGGYLAYQSVVQRAHLRRYLPGSARALLANMARFALPAGTRGRNSLMALEGTAADGIAQVAVWTDHADFHKVSPLLAQPLAEGTPKSWRRAQVDGARGLPGAAMAADFRSYLPEDILVKVDRASMLSSLEVRAPFLDQRVIEFAFGKVPNRLRATPRERKILLRSLARRLLPPSLDINRKQGFTIPMARWLTPPVISAWMAECREEIRAVLSESEVRRLTRERGSVAVEHGLFGVIMLTSWMREYRIAV
jgi:asparagine synthase (glutamine-hydrolysing)